MSQQYDIIHFEALGAEAEHLHSETARAQREGLLPPDLKYLVTQKNVQEYIKQHSDTVLPDIITTKTHSVLPEEYLSGTKKSIITRSTGYDHYETIVECANITSLRNYCVNSVAQTAIKLMYAAAGMLNQYTVNTGSFERNQNASFMEFGSQRVAAVFGVGNIGKRIYELCQANGLTTLAVDARMEDLKARYGDSFTFTTKEDALRRSDIIINAMSLSRNPESPFYNIGYFSEEDLSKTKKGLIFVNITRGEIAPESVLLKLYKEGQIRGIGLDVFSEESALSDVLKHHAGTEDPDVLAAEELIRMAEERTANIYVQPHQAFNSDLAAEEKARDTIQHVVEWYKNNKARFDEQIPYY